MNWMPTKTLRYISYMFIIVLWGSACQEEEREFIDASVDTSIPKDSQLSKLMQRIVLHDGSFDDVVDGSNCFSINYPYTIQHNEEVRVITDREAYETLVPTDPITIEFPITVTLDTHSEVIVNDKAALRALSDRCNRIDEDIECIDFVYPMELSVFTTTTNRLTTETVQHDAELYQFMEGRTSNTVMSMKYPIQLHNHSDTRVTATHNEELLTIILNIENACNENDGM